MVEERKKQPWAVVVDLLYEASLVAHPGQELDGEWSDDYYLKRNSSLENWALDDAILRGQEMGLIERKEGNIAVGLVLTEKGFAVAHERELQQQHQDLMKAQNKTSQTLTGFTIILGVSALIQAVAAIFTASGLQQYLLTAIFVLVLCIAVSYRLILY